MALDVAPLAPPDAPAPTTHHLPATPDTCYWGYIDRSQPAVLEVDDGDVIRVEAITHHAGDAPDLLMDAGITAIWEAIAPDTRGPGVHILTGPIHVRGAEPGDALAVTILDMTPRLPYGSNCAANWGLFYDVYGKERITIYGLDEVDGAAKAFGAIARPVFGFDFTERPVYDLPGVISPPDETARQPFSRPVRVPVRPHFGVMGVAPADEGRFSSIPPGNFGGNVDNRGAFFNGASTPATIAGNFIQSSTGNLGVWLGSTLKVTGTATVGGQMSILGVRSGYTTASKETLLNATGGVSGTFASLKAAPNVFLDATLGYDPNNVFLNINRIDVSKAVAGMGLSLSTQASAQRVESAMQAIDGQLAGALPVTVGARFLDAAGALQQASSIENADSSLRSLSGGLHAASTAMTLDAIDAGRRALNGRIDGLSRSRDAAGGWYRDLTRSGTLAQAGFDGIGTESSGELVGNDWRVGRDAVVGIAMNKQFQSSWLSAFGDRSRGMQRELQLYAAAWQGDWYGQAQLATGSFDRQLQRNLLLGALRDAVATEVSGRYDSAFVEAGRRFDVAGASLVPYVGTQFVQVRNDGFAEQGQTGFGLRAQAWDSQRWQGFAGLRASRGWRVGGLLLAADARAEWQQTLAARGELFAASFTGLEQWSPLQGIGLAQDSRLLGMGLSAMPSANTVFRFDLSRRQSDVGSSTMAALQAQFRF